MILALKVVFQLLNRPLGCEKLSSPVISCHISIEFMDLIVYPYAIENFMSIETDESGEFANAA